MWTLKQTYLCESGETAFCSFSQSHLFRFLKVHFLSFWTCGIPSRTVYVALLLLPFGRCDSFSLVEAEKTHLAQSNMSQCMLYIPFSSQHSSWFLAVLLVFLAEGSMEEKWFLNSRLFWGWRWSLWTEAPFHSFFPHLDFCGLLSKQAVLGLGGLNWIMVAEAKK